MVFDVVIFVVLTFSRLLLVEWLVGLLLQKTKKLFFDRFIIFSKFKLLDWFMGKIVKDV